MDIPPGGRHRNRCWDDQCQGRSGYSSMAASVQEMNPANLIPLWMQAISNMYDRTGTFNTGC